VSGHPPPNGFRSQVVCR